MQKVNSRDSRTVILLLNDFFPEDFGLVAKHLEPKGNILIITNTKLTEKYAVRCIYNELTDPKSVIALLLAEKEKRGLEYIGIIGTDEEYRYVFSKAIADEFNLPFNSKETLAKVTDKHLQIDALKRGGVNVPDFRLVDSIEDAEGFNYPCVIKPIRGISSIHVYRCRDEKELKAAFGRMGDYHPDDDHLSLAHEGSKRKTGLAVKGSVSNSVKRFLLEEFISGNEYSCDFLVAKSGEVIVTRVVRKIVSKDHFPFFEGLYLFNPDSEKSDFTLSQLTDVCRGIAGSLAITYGLCMVDFRYDEKKRKICVIETTTRPGFDDFIDLMWKNYGYISLNILLREIFGTFDREDFAIPKSNGIIVYIFAPKGGMLERFDLSKITPKNIPGLREICQYEKEGSKVESLGVLKTPPFIGHVTIDGIASKDIDSVIEKIRSDVIIEMK